MNTKKGQKKMKNTARNIRAEFEKQLQEAIIKNGEIHIKNDNGNKIDLVTIAEPRGLYAVDEDELLKIECIFQSAKDGSVMAYCSEFGLMGFEFDFTGSKASCYKYLYQHEQQNKKEVAKLLTKHIKRVEKKKHCSMK